MTLAKLKVLFVSSELTPLVKTGGLADVSAALPAALVRLGLDVRILIPGYTPILSELRTKRRIASLSSILPGVPSVTLYSSKLENGLPLLLVVCPELYERGGGPYQNESGHDWPDNAQRFGVLSKLVAVLGSKTSPISWRPDVVHCNDWQTALAPAYLKFSSGKKAASIVTIHNLAFQGVFPSALLTSLELPSSSFDINGVEYYGNISFLKAGLFYADHITTVSPTYAKEIQKEPLGFGLQGLLASRSSVLTGILNGIDTDEWNPATDKYIPSHYTPAKLTAKAINKSMLQQRVGLDVRDDIPLFGVISRFTHQKGLDLIAEIIPNLIDLDTQFVMLGKGEASLEETFRGLARRFPGKVSVENDFNEALSHLIEASSDIFLMPSRFEPCGLNQMYSQRYGTPPVVHRTGGLADSVIDTNPQTIKQGTASGFMFNEASPGALFAAVQRAIAAYRDKKLWRSIQRNAMKKNFGWDHSAAQYVELYKKVLSKGNPA